ncbi:YjiH family protein [Halobacillus kuroshimensis]|uniref:YjiH family protein n=1 Tax=Halobacillus kuroshimensis TaxID=302481 RepID=A0ABS3DV16_9BACI|nr:MULTISPECIES: YjiH family protein [Halobacillus]MBN8235150.1 YjiH family protein [Halobacillus kuroshimensis]
MHTPEKVEQWEEKRASTFTNNDYMKFIIPSVFGALLFLVPIYYNGKVTIGVGIMAEALQSIFEPYLYIFMTVILALSALGAAYTKAAKPRWIMQSNFLQSLFYIHPFWLTIRTMGALFAICTIFKWGPSWLYADITGGTVLYSLIPVLTTWFLFAGLLMPLMLEFGLMEFVGSIFRKIMYPLFKLPGRSSIDAFASWMGSGTVGVLITTRQYEEGFYTKREAAVISTTFSVASIAFSLVVITFIGLEHMFVQFYLTTVVAGLAAAVICPRIPPLSRKKDEYYEPVGKQISEAVPEDTSNFQWGLQKALEKAQKVTGFKQVARQGVQNVIDIWFGLLPLVMALGTLALILAEFTPVFTYLSYPFVGLLNLLQIPSAVETAPAMLVGFADMFLPAVVGSGIESELSRFVIAAVSLTQLIYMSEVGILLIKSKIPVGIVDLLVIFLQRTLITLPIIAVMAHVFFF